MTDLLKTATLPLPHGAIPIIGFGVWQIEEGPQTETAVLAALEAGYRHIDTAKLYQNEQSVGKAIKKSGIPRKELFITTKLWPTDAFNVEEACTKSLERLRLEYVDLYLIHWPIPLLGNKTWEHMEKLQMKGFARSIGVSNYTQSQLEALLRAAKIPPAVNQIEFNPFCYEKELLNFCATHKIIVEAYSPLTRGLHLDNSLLQKIGRQHKKTAAQVMLRWGLQKGVVVLPKSATPKRIIENINIFDFALSQDDMKRIDTIA